MEPFNPDFHSAAADYYISRGEDMNRAFICRVRVGALDTTLALQNTRLLKGYSSFASTSVELASAAEILSSIEC